MNFIKLRNKMVDEYIASKGINNQKVLNVMRKVERHYFVPEKYIEESYDNYPLPIMKGQTISQPYIVALMTECLDLENVKKVLEIGTGSGYQTAILAELTEQVYSIEKHKELAEYSKERLNRLKYKNIEIFVKDGTEGLPQYAPFPRIIVTAASSYVPPPLFQQLEEGGKMIIPLGGRFSQELLLIRKVKGKAQKEFICGCVFVPLIGKYGQYECDE